MWDLPAALKTLLMADLRQVLQGFGNLRLPLATLSMIVIEGLRNHLGLLPLLAPPQSLELSREQGSCVHGLVLVMVTVHLGLCKGGDGAHVHELIIKVDDVIRFIALRNPSLSGVYQ